MKIPETIKKEHIEKAIAECAGQKNWPDKRDSRVWKLVAERHFLPPKFIVSRAGYYAHGNEYPSEDFTAHQARDFLRSHNYQVINVSNEIGLNLNTEANSSAVLDVSESHFERLKWFEENAGQLINEWPKPIGKNGHLLNKAKGIYRPADEEYALSLRIAYGERYGDGPDVAADGSWRLLYHRELRKNQKDPLSFKTNRGVLNCQTDGVPIGVVQQVSTKPQATYKVFGLGRVTDYVGEYFVVEGPISLWGEGHQSNSIKDNTPANVDDILRDERSRNLAEIYRRRGQGRFRREVLHAYRGQCAITGCAVTEILEAAHILPHRGAASDVVQNGILLRADIHTLFDLGLIRVDPTDYTLKIHDTLRKDKAYQILEGVRLRLPDRDDEKPDGRFFERLAALIDEEN